MICPVIILLLIGSVRAHFDDVDEQLEERYLRHRDRDDLKEREYNGKDVRNGQLIHFLAQLDRQQEELEEAKMYNENRKDGFLFFTTLSRNRRSTCHDNGRLRGHFNPRKFMQCVNGQWVVNNCPPGMEFDFVHQAFVKRGTFFKL